MAPLPSEIPTIPFDEHVPTSVEHEWDVHPLIVHNRRVILYGEPGALKSWLLLHLGLHLAAGTPWLGRFAVPRARRVLYIDEEMGEDELFRRVDQFRRGEGLPAGLPFRSLSFFGVRFSPYSNGYAGELLDGIARAADGFAPEIVIVETLRRVLVGNEKEAQDLERFWRVVRPILGRGATFIFSHHMKKYNPLGSNDPFNRASGSGDLIAEPDAAYAVEKKFGRDVDRVIVECTKMRARTMPPPFVVSLERLDPEDEENSPLIMTYEGDKGGAIARTTKIARTCEAILECLVQAPGPVATQDLLALLGLDAHRNSAEHQVMMRALSMLASRGMIVAPTHGCWTLAEAETVSPTKT